MFKGCYLKRYWLNSKFIYLNKFFFDVKKGSNSFTFDLFDDGVDPKPEISIMLHGNGSYNATISDIEIFNISDVKGDLIGNLHSVVPQTLETYNVQVNSLTSFLPTFTTNFNNLQFYNISHNEHITGELKNLNELGKTRTNKDVVFEASDCRLISIASDFTVNDKLSALNLVRNSFDAIDLETLLTKLDSSGITNSIIDLRQQTTNVGVSADTIFDSLTGKGNTVLVKRNEGVAPGESDSQTLTGCIMAQNADPTATDNFINTLGDRTNPIYSIEGSPTPPGSGFSRLPACYRSIAILVDTYGNILASAVTGTTTNSLDLKTLLQNAGLIYTGMTPGCYAYTFEFHGWRRKASHSSGVGWQNADDKYDIYDSFEEVLPAGVQYSAN